MINWLFPLQIALLGIAAWLAFDHFARTRAKGHRHPAVLPMGLSTAFFLGFLLFAVSMLEVALWVFVIGAFHLASLALLFSLFDRRLAISQIEAGTRIAAPTPLPYEARCSLEGESEFRLINPVRFVAPIVWWCLGAVTISWISGFLPERWGSGAIIIGKLQVWSGLAAAVLLIALPILLLPFLRRVTLPGFSGLRAPRVPPEPNTPFEALSLSELVGYRRNMLAKLLVEMLASIGSSIIVTFLIFLTLVPFMRRIFVPGSVVLFTFFFLRILLGFSRLRPTFAILRQASRLKEAGATHIVLTNDETPPGNDEE